MNAQTKTALFFIIVVGAVLRVWQVGFQCLWLEEAYTLNIAALPWKEIISASILSDCNPPVYYLLAHVSEMIFQYDLYAVRYPSVVAGILLIPAMYLLGREYKDELSGVFCSGITAILFPLVYYSQYARAYSLSLLCFSVALIFYIRVSRNPTRRDEICFWVLVALNAWVHLFSLIPLGLIALDLIMQKPWPRIGHAFATTLVCAPLAWMLLAVVKTRAIATGTNYGYDPLMMILITPGELFGVLFVLVAAAVLVSLKVMKDDLHVKLFVVGFVTIATGISLSLFTPFFPRYYLTMALVGILLASPFIVWVAEAIGEICDNIVNHRGSDGSAFETIAILVIVGIIVLCLALQYGDFLTYYTVQKYLC